MSMRCVVMGVSGCGKSTVAAALAKRTGAIYVDGDTLHPQGNIAKMARGAALTDDDRWPWLASVGDRLRPGGIIIACSALKRSYRALIVRQAGQPVTFLHLDGTREVLADRMAHRDRHFMPLSLLDSQLATLERPGPDENAVIVSIDQPVDMIVTRFLTAIRFTTI